MMSSSHEIPSSMLEAIVDQSTSVSLRRVPVPAPRPGVDELLIRVVVAGSNPKDFKRPVWQDRPHNTGDDAAGFVVAAGSEEAGRRFPPGTRVVACHELGAPHGSFAEYAIAPADTTFALPDGVSFEQAATIPLAALTAAAGLFLRMELPTPWGLPLDEASERVKGYEEDGKKADGQEATPEQLASGPILIYGAASAVGAFAVKLAKRARLGPIIAVAGRGIPFVRGLVDEESGDVIIDYRDGDEAVVTGLQKALESMGRGPRGLRVAFDAVSEKGSSVNIGRVLADGGPARLAVVLPAKMQPGGRFEGVAENVTISETWVAEIAPQYPKFGTAMSKVFADGLVDGWFEPHPHEVVPGGLSGGVQQGLRNLRDGKASAVKYVFRVEDTPELAST